jgi:hypothetical protein
MGVHRKYIGQTFSPADRASKSGLKPCHVVPYVGVDELFAVWDYDTQSPPGLQYPEKFAQNGQPKFCVNMLENMLGKYKTT